MNPDFQLESESAQSLGGKARAEALSEKRLSAIGSKGANTRWSAPKATHPGVIRFGDALSFPCSVLSDGTRVLTQNDFMEGMGMYYSGWMAKNKPTQEDPTADLPHFLGFKNLQPFIAKHLGDLQSIVVRFRTEKGNLAHGIKAEIIPKICEIWLDADEAGTLGARQKKIAKNAKIIMRALAHVGIIALIDEATGYQYDRARDALGKILEEFIAKELQPWTRAFPLRFYEDIFRLRKWPFDPASMKSPRVLGKYTNNIVYARLAPGVLAELRKKEPPVDGRRKHKLYRWLTGEVGHPRLLAHFEALKVIMGESATWEEFLKKLDKYYPIIETTELGFDVELSS